MPIQDRWEYSWLLEELQRSLHKEDYCKVHFLSHLSRFMIPFLGERKSLLLFFALGIVTIPFSGIVPVNLFWIMYPLSVARSITFLANPTIKGMMSRQYPKELQGELLGVLTSVRNL